MNATQTAEGEMSKRIKVEVRSDGSAPYGDGELLGEGVATTESGILRIANRESRRHRTTVRVYLNGERASIGRNGRGWWAPIVFCEVCY